LKYQVIATPRFQKESKKIVRKYPGFRSDLLKLIDSLAHQPVQGSHLGEGIYKLRISISGKATGKAMAPECCSLS
jgi:mRNA-degrading endonuclease RelE of RelBE toxin-antitoxin system